MNTIQKIFCCITISFFILVIISLTISQRIPIEIDDWQIKQDYYTFIVYGIPVFLLLTLAWTVRKSNSLNKNTTIILTTLMGVFCSIFLIVFLLITFCFGAWINEEVIFQNKANPEITINKQVLDAGPLWYGKDRIVKLKPYFGFWNIVSTVDTSKINKTKWEYKK